MEAAGVTAACGRRRLLGRPGRLKVDVSARRLEPAKRPAARAARVHLPPNNAKARGRRPRANHGGGGSRTRVREGIQQSRYVRRSLLISPQAVSDRPTPRPATWSLVPELGGTARGPARFIDISRNASGGRTRRRASKRSLRGQRHVVVGSYEFSQGLTRIGSSARYSAFTRHVETVTPPVHTTLIIPDAGGWGPPTRQTDASAPCSER